MSTSNKILRKQRTRAATRLRFETLEPRHMLAGEGLTGEYFDTINLTQSVGTRTDAVINFPNDALGNNAQGQVQSDDNYSIRWTGWVHADQAGQWQFTTFSNDGVRLWVDNTQLIEHWNQHGSARDDGQIQLTAGWHPIRMEYFQQNGTTDARLLFSGPGQNETIIPQASLSAVDPNTGDPIASAGPDRVVVLPTSSLVLDGSATDNGTITTFAWTQLSGPSTATLANAHTEDLTVSGLVQGVYEFQLSVTDNELNTDTDSMLVNVVPVGGQGVITGELKEWHKVTVDFLGPTTSETASKNPFTDYRLDVTFAHQTGGQSYTVPGYYATDGNAANTSATTGNIWRVHFAPDQGGTWAYSTSFRTGSNVAVSNLTNPGVSAGFFDGATGSFAIAATDKSGRDFRGQGRLEYVGEHYLKFAGSGKYFLKQGADSPENLLAYTDFDGPFASDGQKDNLVKNFAPHVADWNPGDPTWGTNQGKGLIGAVNYLSSEGINAFSFLPMNIGGDDRNVFPYLNYNERLRMDVSRLAQWEVLFEHADHLGMFLHFKTQETENELLLDGGNLGTQRKLYYRELIARFSHHLALNWNLGEEINNASTSQKQSWAKYFADNDPYKHHIVIHNGDNHYELLGPANGASGSELTGFSLQTNNSAFVNVHDRVKNYLTRSANAGKPWAVSVDEPGDAQHAIRPDNDAGNSHVDGRKNALWGGLLAGAWGLEYYFGYGHAHSDLTLNDFRSRDDWWDYPRHALDFFNANEIPFWQMTNDNGISSATNDYGFVKTDDTYVVYLKNGGTTNLNLSNATGTFEVKWFDPRNGGNLQEGSVSLVDGGSSVWLGSAPNSPTQDWAILVRRQAAVEKNLLFIRGSAGSGGFLEGGSDEQLADINNQQTFGGNHGWGTFANTLTTAGYTVNQIIEGTTPDKSGTPVALASMNLEIYDAIVFGSNNAVYTTADVDALDQYLLAGGSAMFISDANFGSDWADAANSDQQFLDLIGVQVHQDQGTYVVGNAAGEIFAPNHPVFAGAGPVEAVTQFDGEGVSPFHIQQIIPGAAVTLLAGAEGQTRLNQPPLGSQNRGPSRASNSGDASVFAATYGAGRIVGHYDRNTFFNLNGAGTNISRFDNRQYALNLFDWLIATPNVPGDYNQDSSVDSADLPIWETNFGSTSDLNADGDQDGDVDGNDFLVWQRNFSATTPLVAPSSNDNSSNTLDELPAQRVLETPEVSVPSVFLSQAERLAQAELIDVAIGLSGFESTKAERKDDFLTYDPPWINVLPTTPFDDFETRAVAVASDVTSSSEMAETTELDPSSASELLAFGLEDLFAL